MEREKGELEKQLEIGNKGLEEQGGGLLFRMDFPWL